MKKSAIFAAIIAFVATILVDTWNLAVNIGPEIPLNTVAVVVFILVFVLSLVFRYEIKR